MEDNIDSHTKNAYQAKDHTVIRICPNNGYFTQEVINTLVTWAYNYFKKITIVDPPEVYRYTLEANGTR